MFNQNEGMDIISFAFPFLSSIKTKWKKPYQLRAKSLSSIFFKDRVRRLLTKAFSTNKFFAQGFCQDIITNYKIYRSAML